MEDKSEDMDNDVVVNADMTTTVRLRKPVDHNGGVVDALIFPAEAIVKHLEAADKGEGEIQKAVHLMAAMVELPYRVIRNIGVADFNRCASVMNALVGKDLETGGML